MTQPVISTTSPTALWLAEALRDSIIMGTLPPDETIKGEEVAETYRVEASFVCEAFKLLAIKGWVDMDSDRGVVISPLTAKEAVTLFESRAALEIKAVRESFPKLTQDQITAAEAALLALKESFEEDRQKAHVAYHLALYAAADPFLLERVEQKIREAERYLCFERTVLNTSDADCAEHLALLHAARARDVERATRIIEAHLTQFGRTIAQKL
ncbi:GntR family transcriptional regulator [Pelagibius sp. Alg239-R121]|uniref:GntR family transcriptional regulator n=1 Tax=Pelagibius sp. Alg239-R121 TaxID=2993448 RepID=UPI0024A656D6|nr:GntR family transcriptional regulator [Pelagibius sp. Alg239-R121]